MHALKTSYECESVGHCPDSEQISLMNAIATLSNAELAALEDDLDFYTFTGMASQRMLDVLDHANLLDNGWQGLLAANLSPNVPKRRTIIPRAPHRRDGARHRPFLEISALPAIA